MTVGSLGDIIFEVSSNGVLTFEGLKYSASASYGSHKRHLGREYIEYTGDDASSISLDITLSEILGVDVETEIERLKTYKSDGELLKLIIGKRVIGNYRWVITKLTIEPTLYGARAEIINADVSLTLKEYNN